MKRISCTAFLAITAALLLAPCVSLPAQGQSVAAPAIELGAPFRDSAILQREMPVPVWGWSKQGATVTVEFAGQKESAKAGADGKWMLNLKPLTASAEPAAMVIRESGNQVVLKNILVGEVWHASGQSNMEWFANKSNCMALAEELSKAEEEVPIRELRTDTVSALYPQERVTSEQGWKSSREAGGFSALALSFAHTLHQELKVPVGTVVVTSKEAPDPVGVQYAYMSVPLHANLYNKAGLPASPFAAIDGELMFRESQPNPNYNPQAAVKALASPSNKKR